MSFWESSEDVTLEQRDDGYYLKARCHGPDGLCDSELNLDTYLGNNNGEFQRQSGGFGQSAELVRLEGPEIVCLLWNNDGGKNEVRINLNEFVGNNGGQLIIVD